MQQGTRWLPIFVSSLLGCTLIGALPPVRGQGNASDAEQRAPLQGKAAAFGILSDELQARMGFHCATNESEDCLISDVIPLTAAASCALKPGDVILDAQLQGTALRITIQRGKQIFDARLREIGQKLIAQKAKLDPTPVKPFTLGAEQRVMVDNTLIPETAKADKERKPKNLDATSPGPCGGCLRGDGSSPRSSCPLPPPSSPIAGRWPADRRR